MKIKLSLLLTVVSVIFVCCSAQCTSGKMNKMANNNEKNTLMQLHQQGVLKERGNELWSRMESCDLCPRNCGVNRLEGERGICKANSNLEIASYGPHFGEESELVGRRGSGTIFFTNCAMLCVFCINADVSHGGVGRTYTVEELANIMLRLQREQRHNINLVTPSHYIPHILLALDMAAYRGLNIPVVYNTSGWEKAEILEYLDGVVDIYLSDFKYGCNKHSEKFSIGVSDYVEVAQQAHLEMQRQVGVVSVNPKTGLMERGLIIRHLVMPNNIACSELVMRWIAENLPLDTYVNIMSQYRPFFNARNFPEINRRITVQEYRDVIDAARKAGLTNIRTQGY